MQYFLEHKILSHTHTHTHTCPHPSPLHSYLHPTPPILQFPSPELNSREINAETPPTPFDHSFLHAHTVFLLHVFRYFIHTASPSAVPKFIFISFLVFISFQYVVIRICFAYFYFICFSNLRYILRSHIYAYTHILDYCENDILYAIWYADNNRSSKFHENTSNRFLKKRKLCKDGVLGKYSTPSFPPLSYFFSTSSTSRLSLACILIFKFL